MKVIGIDIGTTSVSSVVIDSEGCLQLASKTLANDTAIVGEKWQNMQDADKIYEKCASLVKEYKDSWPDISRIGITGQMHGMLYIDENGLAVSPLTTWQDERGNQVQENGKTYVQELKEMTGYSMATGFGLTTHVYNQKNGLVPAGARYLVTIMDYVAMRLCGNTRPVTHPSNAAGFGLFDLEKCSFDYDACRRAGIDTALLPEVSTGEEFVGETDDGLAVMIPIGDNQAGILGLVQDEKDIVINVGTSSQISMITTSLPKVRQLEYRPYVNGKYLVLGAGLCGGISFAMLNGFFRMAAEGLGYTVSKDEIFQFMTVEAEKAYENGGELEVCTRFRGTRENPSLRGSVDRISMTNFTPGELTLGFYKGVLTELHEAYLKMERESEEGKLLLCGNALRNNALLRQLCKDLFQRDAVLSNQKEETATGAARLAISGLRNV